MCVIYPEPSWMPLERGPEFTCPIPHTHPSSPQIEVSSPWWGGGALSVSLALSGLQTDRPQVWKIHDNIQKKEDQ